MSAPNHASVRVEARSLWRVRFTRELPRYLLQALALAGLLASARFAIAPPRPIVERASPSSSALDDRAAEGFASLFARRYLTWDAGDPEARAQSLAPFLGSSMEAAAGSPPETGNQQVLWAQVVQARPTPHGHLYTVAAQTDTSGLLYLSVGVLRTPAGALALAGYPAFVGAPASTTSVSEGRVREVEDPALTTVVTRALRNYLGRSATELAADLLAGARVSLPGIAFQLDSIQSIGWASENRSVIAVVQAHDNHNARYTLAYELDVVAQSGRWEVSAIQTNPDS